jgi:hypothetical protein
LTLTPFAVIPGERSESRDLYFAVCGSGIAAPQFHAEHAEARGGAENGLRGRARHTRARFLSIHDFKRL